MARICCAIVGILLALAPPALAQGRGLGACNRPPLEYLEAVERVAVVEPQLKLLALGNLERYFLAEKNPGRETTDKLLKIQWLRAACLAAGHVMRPRAESLDKARRALGKILAHKAPPPQLAQRAAGLNLVLQAAANPGTGSQPLRQALASAKAAHLRWLWDLSFAVLGQSAGKLGPPPKPGNNAAAISRLRGTISGQGGQPAYLLDPIQVGPRYKAPLSSPFMALAFWRALGAELSEKLQGLEAIEALIAAGRLNQAQSNLEKLPAKLREGPRGMTLAGWLAFLRGQNADANRLWEKAWTAAPKGSPDCYRLLGLRARLQGGEAHFQRIQQTAPNWLRGYRPGGSNVACWRLGQARAHLAAKGQVLLDLARWMDADAALECMWMVPIQNQMDRMSGFVGLPYLVNLFWAVCAHQGSNLVLVEDYLGSTGFTPSFLGCLPQSRPMLDDANIIFTVGGAR